jgi:hypothetical protein
MCSVELDSFRIAELWEGVMLHVCEPGAYREREKDRETEKPRPKREVCLLLDSPALGC